MAAGAGEATDGRVIILCANDVKPTLTSDGPDGPASEGVAALGALDSFLYDFRFFFPFSPPSAAAVVPAPVVAVPGSSAAFFAVDLFFFTT